MQIRNGKPPGSGRLAGIGVAALVLAALLKPIFSAASVAGFGPDLPADFEVSHPSAEAQKSFDPLARMKTIRASKTTVKTISPTDIAHALDRKRVNHWLATRKQI